MDEDGLSSKACCCECQSNKTKVTVYTSHSFYCRSHLKSCTLAKRWSLAVIKVSDSLNSEAFKRKIGSSFTVRIQLKTTLYQR